MKRSKIIPVLGIVVGIIAIVLAICVYAAKPADAGDPVIPAVPTVQMPEMDTGTRTSYSYYGGDAYTGIQQAAADTARNVRSLAEITNKGFSVTAQAINNSTAAIRNSAATIIRDLRSSTPDYRLPFSAVLLVMGLSMILSSLRSMNESSARASYEAGILAALKDLGAGGSFPAEPEYTAALEEEPPVNEELLEEKETEA